VLSKKNKLTLAGALLIFSATVQAQGERNGREQISITSSFKPSIIKTDKIEFMPSLPHPDTGKRNYSYEVPQQIFTTPHASFLLKPLAYVPEQHANASDALRARLGYGVLQSPVASVAFSKTLGPSGSDRLILLADHSSFKGSLPDQVYSNSALQSRYTLHHSSTQITHVDFSFAYDAYRTYGFNRNEFRIVQDELKRRMSTIQAGLRHEVVLGQRGQLRLSPGILFRRSELWEKATESHLRFQVPASLVVDPSIRLSSDFDIQLSSLKHPLKKSTSGLLAQLPFHVHYAVGNIALKGGLINAVANQKYTVVPDFSFSYDFGQGGVKFIAGITNRFALNDLGSLFEVNPFLLVPDSIGSFRQTNFSVGFDWLSTKGFHVQMKLGLAQFRNVVLFNNQAPQGKDFIVLYESLLKAYQLGMQLDYAINDKLSMRAELDAYSFYDQQRYEFAFGMLPVQLNASLRWSPFPALRLAMGLNTWNGALFEKTDGTYARTAGGIDLGMDVEYQLNKKWSFWVDLNNIANSRYQRWNQYTCLGFNAIGGIRFSLVGNKK